MSLITLQYTFSVGAVIIASQHNTNFSTIYSDYNGNITDANIAPAADIEYSKLALSNSIQSTDILSSTVLATKNLGSGTANSGSFLRGDSTWQKHAWGTPTTGLSAGTQYGPATVDGVIYFGVEGAGSSWTATLLIDNNNPPTTQKPRCGDTVGPNQVQNGSYPVVTGNYYQLNVTNCTVDYMEFWPK